MLLSLFTCHFSFTYCILLCAIEISISWRFAVPRREHVQGNNSSSDIKKDCTYLLLLLVILFDSMQLNCTFSWKFLLIHFPSVGKCSYGIEERTSRTTYTKNGRWSQEKGSDFAGIATEIHLRTTIITINPLSFETTISVPIPKFLTCLVTQPLWSIFQKVVQ